MRQIFFAAADTSEALGIIIPRRDVGVTDRPVDRHAILGVGLKIEIAQPIGLPPPEQRSPANVIAAHPVESLGFRIGIINVVDEPVRRRRVRRVARARLLELFGAVRCRDLGAALKSPALRHRRRVVAMFHIAAPFEHEGLQAFFAQLLRGPTAADTRADDNRIVGVLFRACALNGGHGKIYCRVEVADD